MLSEHLLEEIIGIVHQCGEIMLSATDIDRKMHQKTGKGNFVTEYDSRVQQVLEEKLLALVPGAVFTWIGNMFSCVPFGIAGWGVTVLLAVTMIPVDLIRKCLSGKNH